MEPFIGDIKLVAFGWPPEYWAPCDGKLLPVAQNQALFSLLGTTFGGDGKNNFALPDLRGRVPVGAVPADNTYGPGKNGGSETVALTTNMVPPHGHTAKVSLQTADKNSPAGNYLAETNYPPAPNAYVASKTGTTAVTMAAAVISTAGGSQGHDNLQPYTTLNFIIALAGVYPTRG